MTIMVGVGDGRPLAAYFSPPDNGDVMCHLRKQNILAML